MVLKFKENTENDRQRGKNRYICCVFMARRQFYTCHSLYHFLYLLWIVLLFNLNVKGQLETLTSAQNEEKDINVSNTIRIELLS